jgi:sugar O-acyltransferase (sialic acid O-acetyltransferase NeuD family)
MFRGPVAKPSPMSAPQRIVVIGAGGQARDTAWVIRELAAAGQPLSHRGFVVSDVSKLGARDSAAEVLGDFLWLREHPTEYDGLAMGIGTPEVRLRLALELSALLPDKPWPALVHPSAIFDRASARLGRGVMVAAGVVGSVNLSLEDFAVINMGSQLGHEARIGRGAVVNPGASVSGGVVLEDGVLIGTGARVLQYLTVRAGATVGAGAVVTKDVASRCVVVGVPARQLEKRGLS